MDRTANYTIKGFLYQFNVTLEKILKSNNEDQICIEGIVEDIDIYDGEGIEAFQCKYHETKDNFTLSLIYKPVLLMLFDFFKNDSKNIKYRLYIHVPNIPENYKLTKEDIDKILKNKNEEYKKILVKINDILTEDKIPKFLENFKIIAGKSKEELEEELHNLLKKELGFNLKDVQDIFYPNVIERIAEISAIREIEKRKVTKNEILSDLRKKKSTAITRWTRELKNYKELLTIRKKQLKDNLSENNRKRYLIFDSSKIKDFDEHIVIFVKKFVNKYSHKVNLHKKLPIFWIIDYKKENVEKLVSRLYKKEIISTTGYVGNEFYKNYFLREPMTRNNEKEFYLRICGENEELTKIFNENKPDDLFIISCKEIEQIDVIDINLEYLEIENLNELEYLLNMGELK